ncbi:cupin domain-containing protein [Natronorubrum texcoconense]|uniref:Cupin domain protein n=1 Tax=Natronorubrum texcoconense TaxID=1095776 RepID=A0A1G9EDB5_9EURY|nr:cupin [Natronorubrum texcoconense]SDK74068.1 Cupin domain protein [Natronorubrum texcoconense]
MTSDTERIDGLLRRTVLKASAVAATTLGLSASATADEHEPDAHDDEHEDDEHETDADGAADEEPAVDEPDGFEVDVIAEHAPFPDELAATFELTFAGDDADAETADATDDPVADGDTDGAVDDAVVVDLEDASTVIVAEVTWTEGGTSGWHRHPGVSIVNMVEGEVEVTWEHDCIPRTYAAGESFFDPGEVHTADSDGGAAAYVTFLGIPDGEPATEWVEPVEC